MPERSTTLDQVLERVLQAPYHRILQREPEGGYSAKVLEFPGCYSGGETAADADANLDEAIASWVEAEFERDRPIPLPIDDEEFSGRLTLRIPPSLHARAYKWAQLQGVSLNRLLALAVADFMGEAEALARPEAFEERFATEPKPPARAQQRQSS